MKIVKTFRAMQLHDKALCLVYVLALITVGVLLGMEKAHAQAGNIYAVPQAQVAGNVYEAQVLQVSFKEVEATIQARSVGAGVGSAAGMLLASMGHGQNRFAVGTVGALVGGLIGERAANSAMKTQAQEIIVRYVMPGGVPRQVSIVQPAPFDQVFPGESVYITETMGTYRVVRRNF